MSNGLSMPRLCLVVLIAFLSSFGFAQVSILTQHNDNSRTGQNLSETYLTTSNVNVSNFGMIFSRSVDGYIYAQPLYVPNLTIQGQTRNVVYVATEHNSVFAFDAEDPSASTPLWSVNLGTSVPSQDICQVHATDGCNGSTWNDLTPEIGITSTPAIDPTTNTLYVVAKTKDTSNNTYHFFLHALDLLGGSEKFSGPVEITMPSTAPVTFDQLAQLQRPGLLLINGAVYVAFGSAGDFLVWHGWVVGYDASTLQQLAYFVTTPTDQVFDGGGCTGGGGIFQAGQGLVADSDNNIYFVTGNGPFDVETGGSDYGDAAIKLSTPALTLADYFAPYNTYNGTKSLGYNNQDLGAGGQLMIPGTTLLIGGGKDGILRLIDSTNMGKFNSTFNADVQEFQASSHWIMGSPVYWDGPTLGPAIYLWTSGGVLQAFQFKGSTFQTSPASKAAITSPCCEGDTSPMSLSANFNQGGTGIIWAPTSYSGDPSFGPQPGILHAFDASNLSELWNSEMNSARDRFGNFAKFNPPTIANGKVYLPTMDSPGKLVVYGLTGPYFSFGAPSPLSGTVSSGSSASYTISVSGVNGFSSAVNLACGGLPSGASCAFNPSSVSPGSTPATSTLIVSTAGTIPNTYNLTIIGTSGSASHNTSVSLVVQIPPGFTLSSATPASVTVSAGSSTTFTTTVTPSGGFSGTVTFNCAIATSASPPPVCTSTRVTVNGAPVPATLTISTTAPHASIPSSRSSFYAMLLPLVGGMTLMGAAFQSSRKKKLLGFLLMALLLSALLTLAACGGSSSSGGGGGGGGSTGGTPAGVYIVTVAGAAGSVSAQPITFTLTVQ